ncbi:MAG: hypothetical protein R2762_29235 [Bryobacteraceae bacterium]
MYWNRSESLILASNKCAYCHGAGTIENRRGRENPCKCVYRNVFRACYTRFLLCSFKERHLTRSRYTADFVSGRRVSWGRKDEEYIADFCLVSRKHLEGIDQKIFRFHFLLGADWKLCCRRLNMDRGTFFHAVYRIQQRLGKVFRELKPYPLYPLEDYFFNTVRGGSNVVSIDVGRDPEQKKRGPLRPPLRPVDKAA